MSTRILSVLLPAGVFFLIGAADPESYTSPDGKFSIAFPAKPTVSKVKDGPLPLIIFKSGDNYAVLCMENPKQDGFTPELAEKALDEARDGLVKSAKGTLISEKKVKLNDKYFGRDVVVQSPDGKKFVHVRFYVVGTKFYSIMVFQDEDSIKNKKDAPFMDSFKIGKM